MSLLRPAFWTTQIWGSKLISSVRKDIWCHKMHLTLLRVCSSLIRSSAQGQSVLWLLMIILIFLQVFVWHIRINMRTSLHLSDTRPKGSQSCDCRSFSSCRGMGWCLPVRVTLKVLKFWKFPSYCSLKPLWSGMGEVVPACTSPTLHPPSPPTAHQLSRLAL